jgi:hypothetical protein
MPNKQIAAMPGGAPERPRSKSALSFLDFLWRRTPDNASTSTRPTRQMSANGPTDHLRSSALYRLKRDSLFLVAKMNEGKGTPSLDAFKRQVVFVQSQLILAAIRDPELPLETKAALVGFQETSIRETVEDRRGIKRRACINMSASTVD